MTTTDETLPLGLYEHLKSASLMSRTIPEGAQWQEEILKKDDYNIPELLTQFFATQLAPRPRKPQNPCRPGGTRQPHDGAPAAGGRRAERFVADR